MDQGNRKLSKKTRINRLFQSLAVILLFVPVLSVISCGSPVDSELTRNEKLWRAQKLTNYDFTLERQCFCPEEWRGPVNIQVRGGVAISVIYVSNSKKAEGGQFNDADTIDKLFSLLHDAYEGRGIFDKKAETVNVTYHPEKGYPLTIFIDVSQLMADEEQGFTVEALVGR